MLQINSRSIQDLHMFGDPSSVPVVIVERVINAPRRSSSSNSYLEGTPLTRISDQIVSNISKEDQQKNGRSLKIVVFVHGFQVYLPWTEINLLFGCI